MTKIPLLDLQKEYSLLKEEIDAAIQGVVDQTWFILGPEVEAFEAEFAEFTKAKHCIGLGSGTDALYIALKALRVGAGDEVITTPMTFIATGEAVNALGAKPVFVDIEPDTHNIDPAKIEAAITENTKVIMPVHLHGIPADMKAIAEIAKKHGLKVVEDAAQAHGASYYGDAIGTYADFACYSFYPGKNLGAYGDAGGVTTNDDALAAEARKLRDHGRMDKYRHDIIGFNFRMDAIQAAVLRVKLGILTEWNDRRKSIAAAYHREFADIPVKVLNIPEWAEPVWHHYTLETEKRDDLLAYLREHGVMAGIHYPIPLHLQPAYDYLGYKEGDFPVSEKVGLEILSLPNATLSNDDLETVIRTVKDFFENDR